MRRAFASLLLVAFAARAAAACPTAQEIATRGAAAIEAGCPAPITGWLYSQVAIDQIERDRADARTTIHDLRADVRRLTDDAAKEDPPPSRTEWFVKGALAAAAAIAAALYIDSKL